MSANTTSSNHTDSGGNYPHPQMHLCDECGAEFEVGDELVSLSDGVVDEETSYQAENIRFFHKECWKNSEYLDTGGDRDER